MIKYARLADTSSHEVPASHHIIQSVRLASPSIMQHTTLVCGLFGHCTTGPRAYTSSLASSYVLDQVRCIHLLQQLLAVKPPLSLCKNESIDGFGRQGNLYRGPPVYTNHLRDPTRTIGFVLVAVQPLPMLITPEKLIP
jgi:hypothetical protein